MIILIGGKLLALAIFIGLTYASTPTVTSNCSYKVVPEEENVTVCQIQINDDDNNVMISASDDTTRTYFKTIPSSSGNANKVTVNVTVIRGLDRELLGDSLKPKFLITDKEGNHVDIGFTMFIGDKNDNKPEYQNLPYNLEIPELPCNTSVVYTRINATDKDLYANGRLHYSMEPKAQSEESRKLFNETFSIDSNTGHVTLKKCLNYENNNYYQFIVTAKDSGPNGGLNSTAEFIIRVRDGQDNPPFFTGLPYRKSINEGIPVGSTVLRVNARDGDPGVSNYVNYTITNSNCGDDLFSIDSFTGVIKTISIIDRNSAEVSNRLGYCELTVKVEEILSPNQTSYGPTTATTNVYISIRGKDTSVPVGR